METKNTAAFGKAQMIPRAIRDAFVKLNPKLQIQNPVMFIVYVAAILTSGLFAASLFGVREEAAGQDRRHIDDEHDRVLYL